MMTDIQIMKIDKHEIAEACELIIDIFNKTIAPLYSEKGVNTFLGLSTIESMIKRFEEGNLILVAKNFNNKLIGIIESKNGSHISRLFVDVPFHRKGVGRQLFSTLLNNYILKDQSIKSITVCSSPNSINAYKHLGFVPTDNEKEGEDGIKYIPMIYKVRN